jgi:predicted SAM-dependent methyltransferase
MWLKLRIAEARFLRYWTCIGETSRRGATGAGVLTVLGGSAGPLCCEGMNQQPQGTGPLRLHIGGWEKKDGWKILDVDVARKPDFAGSCSDLTQFADSSVIEIYASHVYEHLDYAGELQRALGEAFRVLKPGGLIRIGVPDLEVLCKLIIDTRLSVPDRFEVQRMMFGGHVDAFDYHKVGLTFDFLKDFLELAGFVRVQRVRSFGLFNDATSASVYGTPISLNVSAMRPV